ncbi:MAG: hypothetical protein E6670_05125 [Veillonella parvula]|nr:hypothetical protein [Veillonella parvula]
MVKVQLINRQSGSLLAEWIITIGLILLLISIALPIVTTPSRYTLNGATQEVAYMLKKVQLWSMLGHKSNGKGRMLFILNKDSYTLEEDVNHHTVNILLPQNIENERSMTIISLGGKKCTEGFMYGDALISAAIIMLILPIVLSIFWMATLTVYKAYYWDHILQDTITYLEKAKASYYKTGTIEAGVYNSQFTMSPSEKITYKTHIKPVVIEGVSLQRLTVDAIDNQSVVYSLSVDLEGIH